MFQNDGKMIFLLILLLFCTVFSFYFEYKTDAKEQSEQEILIDYGSIHHEAYIAYLRKIGKIKATTTSEQIEKIIKQELQLRQNPFSLNRWY